MANFVSYADAQQLMTAIGNKFASFTGAYVPKGSLAFESLPATVTSSMLGWVYNITDDFTTDSRFVEGSGKDYPAGSNVVAVQASAATYAVTSDTTAQSGKTYYERKGSAEPYTYEVKAVNVGDDVTGLYEKTADAVFKYDVLAGFIDISDIEADIDNIKDIIAPEFDENTAYAENTIVFYEDNLYRFTQDHAAGAWDSSQVTTTTIKDEFGLIYFDFNMLEGSVTNLWSTLSNVIAENFNSANAYAVGDIVLRSSGGPASLYKFTSTHTAGDPWSSSEVTQVTIKSLIDQGDIATKTTVENLIAPEFAAADAYAVGDVVTHEDGLYKFTSAHTAGDPWDATEVSATKVASLVSSAEPESLTPQQIADLEGLLD